jgi:signal transduction histidine kinase
MAVKRMRRSINQFWPIFFKKRMTLTVIAQIVLTLMVGLVLLYTNTLEITSTIFWIIIGLLLLTSLVINLLITASTMQPTKDLVSAILSISDDKTALTPPNPNLGKYQRSGLGDGIQEIYKLSNDKDNPEAEAANKVITPSAFISSALDTTTCGLIAMDSKRRVVYANPAAPVHTDINGQTVINLFYNNSDTPDAWLDTCSEENVRAEHIWTRIPDRLPNVENRRFFDVFASYQKGAIVETVFVLVERTSKYLVDEEGLDFIAFAAHELRGPITVIRGYLDVLQDELDGVLKNDQKELFRRLVVSANRLSGDINNILNTSRYDRRHLKVHLVEDTVTAVYNIISDDMQLRASSQNRMLSVNIPDDLPTIAVDRDSMSEVLSNLIDNAIKYSNEGGLVKVTAKTNSNFVDISVEDHGIGMPESVVSNLFQKFYRSHRSRETVAGTGIGLYISKAIVESHGGTISVRSEDGHGSIFTVSLPTYATVADKLKTDNNSNIELISEGKGWIKNHSMYRG